MFSEDFLHALHAVNQDVAADMPHNATQTEIAELCLDEYQFAMRGFHNEWNEYKALQAEHGWEKVFNAVPEHIVCW